MIVSKLQARAAGNWLAGFGETAVPLSLVMIAALAILVALSDWPVASKAGVAMWLLLP
jgi:hypothetical protein